MRSARYRSRAWVEGIEHVGVRRVRAAGRRRRVERKSGASQGESVEKRPVQARNRCVAVIQGVKRVARGAQRVEDDSAVRGEDAEFADIRRRVQ